VMVATPMMIPSVASNERNQWIFTFLLANSKNTIEFNGYHSARNVVVCTS
jgi:hypothetical protein